MLVIASLTQTSMGPSSCSARCAAASTWSGSATSVGMGRPVPPASSTSRRAPFKPSSPRASRAMRAPRAPKARAVARPTPALAPVTTMVLMPHLLPVAVRASNGEGVVRVFEYDDELFAAVPADARDLAVRHGIARVRSLPIGTWEASAEDEAGALGLLILDGLILHDVRVGSVTCTELLARQDLLRPWDEDPELQPVPMETAWRVIAPARLAVLDRRLAVVAGRFPDVMATLLGRTMTRARWVVAMMSISHMHRVEARLEACLWYLADRFGRVTAEGVVLPLPLTHLTLARLVGAQRPSVTTALGELAEQGRVMRRADGTYLLRGDPPTERTTTTGRTATASAARADATGQRGAAARAG